MSDQFASLPLVTVAEILSRLPLESLGRCRCVCKTWYSVISDPFFINTQLRRYRQGTDGDNRYFFLSYKDIHHRHPFRTKSYPSYCYSLRCCETFVESRRVRVPRVIHGWNFMVLGSYNGLLCLYMCSRVALGYSRVIVLWNPSIHKFKILPKPHFTASSSAQSTYGFGFAPRANDYKVVRLIDKGRDGPLKVEIYNLSTDSWRAWSGDAIQCTMRGNRPVFVNGAVYWTAYRPYIRLDSAHTSNLILSFHMEDEVFKEMPTPGFAHPIPNNRSCGFVQVISEKLAFFGERHNVAWDIWVMEDRESWTKLHTIRMLPVPVMPVQCLRNSEFLVDVDNRLFLFDFETSRVEILQVDGMEFSLVNYVESFVLLTEGIDDSSDATADFEEKEEDEEEELGFMSKVKKFIKEMSG